MSTGGIFQLITNDGKQDRMLMASELLKSRLNRIMDARKAAGVEATPTLVDIEKTHVLFMNAHFKPFAALGYEYNKVQASSGTVTLGSTVQFSIPQFGDFFHDMVLHCRLNTVTANTAAGTWRWVAYPGEKLIEHVKFTVNGNPLDEYYTQDYQFYRNFELPENKKVGYMRCAGQQEYKKAIVVPGSSANVAGTSGGDEGWGATAQVAHTTGIMQPHMLVTTGYQTPKATAGHSYAGTAGAVGTAINHQRTDRLEVTMPLLFWFNRDPRLAVPSVSIPYGQRFIEVTLTSLNNLVKAQRVTATDTNQNTDAGTMSVASPEVPLCHLYVNNIFVNPEIHDIFIKRIGFNLIRVHRRQVKRLSDASNGEELLNNLKWPIESIAFGFRKVAQNTAAASGTADDADYLDGWHYFADVTPVSVETDAFLGGVAGTEVFGKLQWLEPAPVVQHVSFQAHGVVLYNEIPAIFYNQYFPLVRGDKIACPEDPGAYFVGFNLYPGVYQPSGHVNISRAREFYIKFDDAAPSTGRNLAANLVDSTYTVDLIVSACAINFLLISDGSAVLRYST